MTLRRLSIVNYKNIGEAVLDFSPKMNCFIGDNGAGKTNVLDAIYFLSFCRSAQTTLDSQAISHGAPFCVLEAEYEDTACATSVAQDSMKIYCGIKRGVKKQFKCNKKAYKRLSEHIGLIPLVMVSPSDTYLIEGGSEERRRLMDMVISQLEHPYMESLVRYTKAWQQRNAMLRDEAAVPDLEVMGILEEQMAAEGEYISARRQAFVSELVPLFQSFYERVSGGREQVSLRYTSHCQRGPLLDVIREGRPKDMAVGYSLHGVHRDDLEILLDGHPMRREGSQGQQKTFVIALKLAQFGLLKRGRRASAVSTTPLLLLDDIFDKLDATRVEQIVSLVSGDEFGQIFITDTNRDHLDRILAASSNDYKLFDVTSGVVSEKHHG